MRYTGDGLSFAAEHPTNELVMTVDQRSSDFELPSLIKIGASYDFYVNQRIDTITDQVFADHTVTLAANFTSNSRITREVLNYEVI